MAEQVSLSIFYPMWCFTSLARPWGSPLPGRILLRTVELIACSALGGHSVITAESLVMTQNGNLLVSAKKVD